MVPDVQVYLAPGGIAERRGDGGHRGGELVGLPVRRKARSVPWMSV
jgi:hypothetical protein